MSTLAERRQELLGLDALRFVTGTFFELSAEKIGRLRSEFEKNRKFFSEISGLYEAVRRAAARAHPEKANAAGRSVSVAFTSNAHFYGSINAQVVRTLLEHVAQAPEEEVLIIGNTGKAFVESYGIKGRAPTFLSFGGDDPSREEIRQFLQRVEVYDHVNVFHPSFVNVFTQEVAVLDITHAPSDAASDEAEQDTRYIFEPELSRVLSFFETRVRYLLFRGIMFEAELARTAARLLSMNEAEDRADSALSDLRRRMHREEEAFKDARLLETFSGIAKWKQ